MLLSIQSPMLSLLRVALAACATFCILASASAEPSRPVRIVLGSLPAAGSDAVARLLAESLGKSMGRTFIVENKPGASGNIAADYVAKAPGDGSTLLLVYNAHPAVAALFPKLPFDPLNDFRPVGMVGTTPYVLIANPSVPGATLGELISQAKAQGRALSFGSPGTGTPQHLAMEKLKKEARLDINIIQYKSSAPAQNDVIAGHIDLALSTPSLALPHVKAGKLKSLAVTSSIRLQSAPEVPTVAESGVTGFVSVGWYALLAPASTPPAIARKYAEALNSALASTPLKQRLEAMGITPTPGSPEVLDHRIRAEYQMWKGLIRELGIKPE